MPRNGQEGKPVVADDDGQVHRLPGIHDAVVVVIRVLVFGVEEPVLQVGELRLRGHGQGGVGVGYSSGPPRRRWPRSGP